MKQSIEKNNFYIMYTHDQSIVTKLNAQMCRIFIIINVAF